MLRLSVGDKQLHSSGSFSMGFESWSSCRLSRGRSVNPVDGRKKEPVRSELCVVRGGWEVGTSSVTTEVAFPGWRGATEAALVGLDGSAEPG